MKKLTSLFAALFSLVWLTGAGWLPLANSGAGYIAQGVSFSSATRTHRAAALTGVTDSKTGMVSFWFRAATGTDGQFIRLISTAGGTALPIDILRMQTTGVFRFTAQNSAASNLFQISTTSTALVGQGWKHVLASWNLATPILQIYVNDGVEYNSATGLTNDVIDYATSITDYNFPDSSLPGPFDIADFWFDPNQTPLDLSVTANRRKFISAGLAPVNLGATGATPTGTAPAIFFSGAAASWNTNKGTGGGFTITADSITNASSNPP